VDGDVIFDGLAVPHDYLYVDDATPGYQDQNWSGRPAMCTDPLGSFLPDTATDTGRSDDQWINVDPSPTKSQPWYGSGVLDPLNLPTHGEKNAGTTDLQYWGPTDFDAQRDDHVPAYLRNYNSTELSGKEINRPASDYFDDWGQPAPGDEKVEWATGSFSGFTPNARLQGLNRNYRFATFTDPDRPTWGAPTVTGGAGGGRPPVMAEVSLGSGLTKAFVDFWQRATGAKGRSAPPVTADITLPGATRRNSEALPITGDASAHSGGLFGGLAANPGKGGRMGLRLPWVFRSQPFKHSGGKFGGLLSNLPQGGLVSRLLPWSYRVEAEKHAGGACGGLVENPPQGGRDSRRVPWSFRVEAEKHGGGTNGGLVENPPQGGRQTRRLPWSYRVEAEKHGGGTNGGFVENPPQGGRQTRRLPWSYRVEAEKHGGGTNGGLAENPPTGGRDARRIPWTFRVEPTKHAGGAYSGMCTNSPEGGRDSRKLEWSYRVEPEKHSGGAFGGIGENPPDGGRLAGRLPWSYRVDAEKHSGGGYGGMEANAPVGGRASALIPWTFRVGGEKHSGGGFGGMESNPVQGGGMRRNPAEIWPTEGAAGALSGTAGGQDLANNPPEGAHAVKMPENTPAYRAPRGGISGFGGEECVGTVSPLRGANSFPYPIRLGGGGAGKTEVRSERMGRSDLATYERGGDVRSELPIRIPSQVADTALYSSIVGERSEDALGDLFDVLHS
jgi:hypothetical protein